MATYSNSSLISYKCISPNKDKTRIHPVYNPTGVIDKITIHHMAGNLKVETCGNMFAKASNAVSSNYGIGSDGRIALYVDEKHRSWCSSSPANDYRAITIEVANDKIGGNWHVSDKAMASLIKLCVDICKRNNIKQLNFTGDKTGNLTMHKWFAPTACPGPYLESKFSYIAKEVNKQLTSAKTTTKKADNSFKAKVIASSLNIRAGAGTNYKKVGTIKDKGTYTIVETKSGTGSKAGWGKLKSGVGWISLDYVEKVK